MKSQIRQLMTVFWEHYKIRKRHFILTFLELCLPVITFILVAFGRSKLPSFNKEYIPATYNYMVTDTLLSSIINVVDTKLFYSPKTQFTTDLARKIQLKLYLYDDSVKGFDGHEDIMRYYKESGGDGITVIVNFDDVGYKVPTKLIYNIQLYEEGIDWQTDKLFKTDIRYFPGAGSQHYLGNQFLAFQWALDTSYTEMLTKSPLNITMNFEEFPYPPHWIDNGMNDIFVHLLPLLTMLSFIFLFPSILKVIVEEKSSGMKQLMKINGLKSWAYWIGWLLNGCIPCTISAVVISVLLTERLFNAEYASLQHVSVPYLALLILLYSLATISFIFAFSVFFKDAILAMISGITTWFLFYIIYASIVGSVDILPLSLKYFASLIPTLALYNGFQVISVAEIKGSPIGFTEQPRGCDDDMTMQMTFIMLIIDIIFYLVIAICCDTDPHGQYIISKFYTNFKIKFKKNVVIGKGKEALICIEEPDEEVVLEIKDLTKRYGEIVAVDGLSMKIYRNNLTVILGHNGAGKTTLISILAGLEKATSGKLIINEIEGVNLKDRQLISICPQESMLFPELSVEQHLVFFGKLKGLSDEDIKKNVEDLLNEKKLNLLHKRHYLIKKLSGGMKRKLSIGIALMGAPKFVILDEPTSCIDTEGRRDIWDIILECKKNSNIILITHIMEEAELLADRVAILKGGSLKCYGTPMFLKQELKDSYRIQLFYKDKKRTDNIQDFIIQNINAEIIDPGLHTANLDKFKIEFCTLPEKKSKLPNFLKILKAEKESLSITDYKILSNMLEDVFLRTLENHNSLQSNQDGNNPDSNIEDNTKDTNICCDSNIQNNNSQNQNQCFHNNQWQTFMLIAKKNFKILRSMVILWISMITIFYLFFILTFTMNDSGHKNLNKDGKTLPLNLDSYGSNKVFYEIKCDKTVIEQTFWHLIQSTSSSMHKVENISEAVIRVGVNNIVEYRQKLIVGSKIICDETSQEVIVMYSNQAIHGAPISLNLISNVLAKYFGGKNYEIVATHTPLRSAKSEKRQTNVFFADYITSWMIILSNAILFSVIMFSALPTLEKNSFMKTLSMLYNLNSRSYWLYNYITDITFYFIIITPPIMGLGIACTLNLVVLKTCGFQNLVSILIWYGTVMIPHTYLYTIYTSSVASVIALLLILNMLCAIPAGVILSLQSIDSFIAHIFLCLFSVVDPHIVLTYTLSIFCNKMIKNHNWDMKTPLQKENICNDTPVPCCDPESVECAVDRTYIQHPVYLIISFVSALIIMIIIIVWDKQRIYKRTFKKNVTIGTEKLRKEYKGGILKRIKKTKPIEAVKNLSFEVSKGECYGLLGVDGAGKTTLVKILTNQEQPDKGEIIQDKDSLIGYCPQEHALLYSFTGRELLEYFGKLRNLSINEGYVDKLLEKCGLHKYRNQSCGTYSRGNKRKLNICIALIGNPNIIILDEPTTGVDVENKKLVRDLIAKTKSNNKSAIIVASHSMDEYEFLYDKLSIMKEGEFVEGGNTVPELKEKYNVGNIVQIKIEAGAQTNAIIDTLKSFLGNVLIDEIAYRNNHLTVSIKNSDWGSIIEGLENMKENGTDIVDYMVKESSLEEVFLKVEKR